MVAFPRASKALNSFASVPKKKDPLKGEPKSYKYERVTFMWQGKQIECKGKH